MKTTICFENEELSCRCNSLILKEVRRLYQDDFLIVISAGDFSSEGVLLEPACRKRAEEYVKEGTDLILSLSAVSVLGGSGTKEFAGVALMQRLRAVDRLVIPCTPAAGQTPEECGKTLRSFAMLMFRNDPAYSRRLEENLKNNMPLKDAQLRAVCDGFPEAEALFASPDNRHALWLLHAMLQLYYMAKTEFICTPALEPCTKPRINADHFEKAAVQKLAAVLESASMEKLLDISGSTTQMADALLENKDRICQAQTPEQIVGLLQPAPTDRIRLFLLKTILGVRKIYMQICSLREFVPYCYVTAQNRDKSDILLQLQEKSWVPFVTGSEEDQKIKNEYSYLLQADCKAEELILEKTFKKL